MPTPDNAIPVLPGKSTSSQRPISSLRFWLPAVCVACILLTGCGGGRPADPEALADAQSSYDQALVEIESGNHAAALELLVTALAPGGGLPPDLYTDALVQRAVCYARAEQFDEALADLELAEQGVSDLSTVGVARAYVYRKQGKLAEAKREMSAAKKINRKARSIKD